MNFIFKLTEYQAEYDDIMSELIEMKLDRMYGDNGICLSLMMERRKELLNELKFKIQNLKEKMKLAEEKYNTIII